MRLDDNDTAAVLFCVAEAVRTRRRAGRPIPQRLHTLLAKLDLQVRVSAEGHRNDSPTAQSDPELIDTNEAANLLGRTPRHVRRLAPDLDAHTVGGRWLYPKHAVLQYRKDHTTWTPSPNSPPE